MKVLIIIMAMIILILLMLVFMYKKLYEFESSMCYFYKLIHAEYAARIRELSRERDFELMSEE